MIRPELFWKLVRFAVVGLTVMLFFMGANALFARWTSAQTAFLLSYPPALALHFGLNKWWTFGCQRTDAARQLGEYVVMVVVTFIIQWAVFTAVTSWTTCPPWLAAGIANVAQMAITFAWMNRRVFAAAPAS